MSLRTINEFSAKFKRLSRKMSQMSIIITKKMVEKMLNTLKMEKQRNMQKKKKKMQTISFTFQVFVTRTE